jgi:hypothetical protein
VRTRKTNYVAFADEMTGSGCGEDLIFNRPGKSRERLRSCVITILTRRNVLFGQLVVG